MNQILKKLAKVKLCYSWSCSCSIFWASTAKRAPRLSAISLFGLCHGKIHRVLEDDHDHEHESSTLEFRLNDRQKTAVEKYYAERGEAYVLEKAVIVDPEPRENAARAF